MLGQRLGEMVPFTSLRAVETKWARGQERVAFHKRQRWTALWVPLVCSCAFIGYVSALLEDLYKNQSMHSQSQDHAANKCLFLSAVHMNGRVKKKQLSNTGPATV